MTGAACANRSMLNVIRDIELGFAYLSWGSFGPVSRAVLLETGMRRTFAGHCHDW